MRHPTRRYADEIEKYNGVNRVGRSLYMDSQYVVIVDVDEAIGIICELWNEFKLHLDYVKCSDTEAGIHCSKPIY